MPEGSRNEWRDFFDDCGVELEANAFFPLFWRALFGEGDIHHARFIDEHDVDDEDSAIEREEQLLDFGAEATYPYLVTDQATARARLAARREQLIATVGERYRPIYTDFEALIATRFAPHILLRTSGLPDAADAQPWLRADLAAVERLDPKAMLADLAADLSRYDADPIWLLTGRGTSNDEPWPSPALAALFAKSPKQPARERAPAPLIRPTESTRTPPTQRRAARWLESALEWMGALAAAVAALSAYVFTRSGWLAVLAFLCVAVAWGFAMARVNRRGR